MASIKITDLRPVGSELFQDSETFLNELNDQEVGMVLGGAKDKNKIKIKIKLKTIINIISQQTISLGISLASVSAVSGI